MREVFRNLARNTANLVGSYWAFSLALLAVCVWAATGPYFNYSDAWQLVINTGTTIVTFLMVFLIQNAQNRDARIIELKLDELLRGVEGARTGFVKLDHMSDEELESIRRSSRGSGKSMPHSLTTTFGTSTERSVHGRPVGLAKLGGC